MSGVRVSAGPGQCLPRLPMWLNAHTPGEVWVEKRWSSRQGGIVLPVIWSVHVHQSPHPTASKMRVCRSAILRSLKHVWKSSTHTTPQRLSLLCLLHHFQEVKCAIRTKKEVRVRKEEKWRCWLSQLRTVDRVEKGHICMCVRVGGCVTCFIGWQRP